MDNYKIRTCEVVVSGKIQGVGFRPFIKNLAAGYGLTGEVKNSRKGVVINVSGRQNAINVFIENIQAQAPQHAFITKIKINLKRFKRYSHFSIVKSDDAKSPNLIIVPDLSICKDCLLETCDPSSRRFQYPFNSCLNCGPRYSLIKSLPYDRDTTSMAEQEICTFCLKEYEHENGRREHAQSISCGSCPIKLSLYSKGNVITTHFNSIINRIKKALTNNQLIMIKGTGGYLLCCNALSSQAIQNLRFRKNRPRKPFAVMYKSMAAIKESYKVSLKEEQLLASSIAPIILLTPIDNELPNSLRYNIERVGVMLPSTGLLSLILQELPFPLVATSGNRNNEAIVFEDHKANDEKESLADLVLTYDLEIQMPQDDSLTFFTPKNSQKVILRRSRGMAPEYLRPGNLKNEQVIAFGSDMKSTMTIQHHGNLYISQYIGDLLHLDNQNRFTYIRTKLSKILDFNGKLVLTDKNENFHSTQLANDFALVNSIDLKAIYHHEAHFAAILGEHDLWSSNKKILGVIWDGFGLGADNNIWGGEFYSLDKNQIHHVAQFQYKPWILGDKMSREPRISALSYFKSEDLEALGMKDKFTKQEWNIYSNLVKKNGLKTSSVGRLFDAVSSVLDLCDYNEFEGQAAILLEQTASKFSGDELLTTFPFTVEDGEIYIQEMCSQIVNAKLRKVEVAAISYKFHLTLVHIIKEVAQLQQIHDLSFSGGVFQNGLLIELIIDQLGNDFNLYFHKELSPNDENISFGQIMHYNNVST